MRAIDESKVKFTQREIIFLLFLQIFLTNETQMSIKTHNTNYRTHWKFKKKTKTMNKSQHK